MCRGCFSPLLIQSYIHAQISLRSLKNSKLQKCVCMQQSGLLPTREWQPMAERADGEINGSEWEEWGVCYCVFFLSHSVCHSVCKLSRALFTQHICCKTVRCVDSHEWKWCAQTTILCSSHARPVVSGNETAILNFQLINMYEFTPVFYELLAHLKLYSHDSNSSQLAHKRFFKNGTVEMFLMPSLRE